MIFRILQTALPFIWFGMVGAISFMEAPLKFTAPNVTLPIGLGIGRIIFHTLNKIEIVCALLLIVALLADHPKTKTPIYLFAVILILLILETVWLLPVLDVRAEAIIAGETPPASVLHFVYIIFDAIKFLLLFALGAILTKQNLRFE